MIKDATKQIIQRTLQSSFDKEQFLNFTKNLLNHINEDKAFHAHGYVKEQFKKTANIIKTYERLGTYTDPNEKKIDILVVYLAKDNSIDRARTSLRNFVADYLKGRDQKDAALVAFVSPSQDDWRFSLIKMEYKFEEGKSGKMKVKEEFTPARRWSFLVGSKESSHTAQSRLAPILEDDEGNPTLEQLEDAFNIEKVTKEFFEKYRELFLGLKDNLDEMVKNDAKIKADFAKKDVDTVDFAKKLLGQIVFLYFLQKKGWFGVERDANWGTGPKDFLRQLYNKKHSDYKNFFNEILEPMFYEALARERDDDYYGRFNCKIPFLNGGLFDPIGNYDWVHTDINLDNELFSNSRPTKQGDIGDGILDVFDRYNFTVREDEPLEKEVAVDPEMLGKVFENLLEVKDRKSKGTYYTPREIVQYMCEQSLINYLATELPEVDKNDLEEFIKIGGQVLENEYWVTQKGDEDDSMIPKLIKKNVEIIDQKLAEIKVCDPAIGSGAFPVGMMGEIVNARLSLNPYLCHSERNEESPSLECAGRTAYDFKMQAITNSIYGVDIDPGAVEIAKLRLWLSLVVDENDIKNIKPLPNLDYKIMQGNSLLEEFEGIKLFDESIIPQDNAEREAQITKANEKINELQREFFRLHSKNELSKSQEQLIKQQIKGQQKLIQSLQEKPKQGGTVDLFNQIDKIKAKWDELTDLHKKIVKESNRQEKKKMLDRASELEWQFIEATLKREDKSESLKKIEQFKKKNTKPFFLWHLHFADVFQSKGGFDVVIANPPYVSVKEIPENQKKIFNHVFETGRGRFNLFTLFLEKGINILRPDGVQTFILPEGLYSNVEYQYIRKYILDKTTILYVNLFSSRVFDAAVDTSIISINNHRKINSTFPVIRDLAKTTTTFSQELFNDLPFNIFTVNLDRKSREIAFKVIKGLYKNLGQILEIQQGIIYSGQTKEKVFAEKPINSSYKKCLDGRDILKWLINWNNKNENKYICYSNKLHRPREERIFLNQEKILLPRRSTKILCAFDNEKYYCLNTAYICLLKDKDYSLKFILGILNSSLINYVYSKLFFGWQITIPALESITVPLENQDQIVGLVNKVLDITKTRDYITNSAKQAEVKEYEYQIDKMVYKIYDLTAEEIKIVESP